jgi:hypothetical protein
MGDFDKPCSKQELLFGFFSRAMKKGEMLEAKNETNRKEAA